MLGQLGSSHTYFVDLSLDRGATAASRWASLVVRATECELDPRTLLLWGRCVGASVGTLRSRCIAVGVRTKASLDFARLLRAVIRSRASGFDISIELDVYDPRTLYRLLLQGGLANYADQACAPSLGPFLQRQRLVHHELALRCVAQDLADRGLLDR